MTPDTLFKVVALTRRSGLSCYMAMEEKYGDELRLPAIVLTFYVWLPIDCIYLPGRSEKIDCIGTFIKV
uniref:Uncharacterized protein n=1 Tax=Panagrolaimus sp. PS1159 TaxID=55785 RepID=A0AC35GAI2_9BILA